MIMKKQLIAGNWKMNGSLAENDALVRALVLVATSLRAPPASANETRFLPTARSEM